MNDKLAFLQQVSALPKSSKRISLQRVELLMHSVVSPAYLEQTAKIVITGTNGKGSTSMMVDSILRQQGIKVGLFTSPHFLEFSERFRINGQMPDYKLLHQISEHVLELSKQIEADLNEKFCFFEILFVIALALFEREHAELLVFEAGIGGRYDPVRLLKADLTALTSVAKEHTAILGDSEELIAFDKLDACYPGGKTVIGRLEQSLVDKINVHANLRNVEILNASDIVQAEGNTLKVKGFDRSELNTQILGLVQTSNMQVAVTLCKSFFADNLPENFVELCQKGLAECHIPGRFEKIADGPQVYIDAAHTDDAFEQLFETIRIQFGDKPVIFVAGISQGRDNKVLAKQLVAVGDEIIITQPHFRGEDPEKLFVRCTTQNKRYLEQDVHEALVLAKQRAAATGGRIFVVGSLFLAGEVTAMEKGMPIEQLYLH